MDRVISMTWTWTYPWSHFFRKWSTLGFCGLCEYFAVMWEIFPRHQIMPKPHRRLPFCYSCSHSFGELRVHALLCYSLVFPDLVTFFFPASNTKEKPSGVSRVSSVGWRAAVTLLEWRRVGSGSRRLCSVFYLSL